MRLFADFAPRSLLCAGLVAAGLALAPLSHLAAQEEGDSVVASVNGEAIYLSEVIRSAQNLPQQYQQNLQQIFPALVQRAIDMRLMEAAGRVQGLDQDEQVRARVAAAEREAISQAYLQGILQDSFTEEALDAAYARWTEANPPQDEVRARHILVEEEAQARELIAEIEGGADFAALAEEHSLDPSAAGRGGDLGWFTRERMVAPFAEAAFEIEPGSHGAEPVETRFGWHVILVEDRREGAQPSRDEVAAELQEMIAGQVIEETRTALRSDAEIELFELGGSGSAPPPAQ